MARRFQVLVGAMVLFLLVGVGGAVRVRMYERDARAAWARDLEAVAGVTQLAILSWMRERQHNATLTAQWLERLPALVAGTPLRDLSPTTRARIDAHFAALAAHNGVRRASLLDPDGADYLTVGPDPGLPPDLAELLAGAGRSSEMAGDPWVAADSTPRVSIAVAVRPDEHGVAGFVVVSADPSVAIQMLLRSERQLGASARYRVIMQVDDLLVRFSEGDDSARLSVDLRPISEAGGAAMLALSGDDTTGEGPGPGRPTAAGRCSVVGPGHLGSRDPG